MRPTGGHWVCCTSPPLVVSLWAPKGPGLCKGSKRAAGGGPGDVSETDRRQTMVAQPSTVVSDQLASLPTGLKTKGVDRGSLEANFRPEFREVFGRFQGPGAVRMR